MTIHHLLTHTSGLPENEWENFYKGKAAPYTTEEQVKTFRDRPLGFQPGTAWKYRNTEYYLLAYIVEKLSGESYATYLAHHIFEPLKMTHSGFATMAAIVPQMSEGYSREGSTRIRREYFDRSMETGAGGPYTTAEDMLRWNKGLDSPGLLSAQALDFMFTAHPPGNYGAGWFIETSPGARFITKAGTLDLPLSRRAIRISMSSSLCSRMKMILRSETSRTRWQSNCLATEAERSGTHFPCTNVDWGYNDCAR